jgi:hypothetical protein
MTPILANHARAFVRGLAGSARAYQRGLMAAALAAAVLAAGVSCDNSRLTDPLSDQVPPAVTLSPVTGVADSLLAFAAHVTDNLGILNVQVQASGDGISGAADTTFHSANTVVDLSYALPIPAGVPLGTTVMVVAVATDGAHNVSRTDTLFLATGNQTPSLARIISPTAADSTAVGFLLPVTLSGLSPNKVRALGFMASGVFAAQVQDSTLYPVDSLLQSTTTTINLDLTGATAGTLTLTPFLVDSLGRRVVGAPVNVTVTATAATNTIPAATFGITDRIEVGDTIHVKGADRAGIRYVGYRVSSIVTNPPTCGAFTAADSLEIAGNVNPVDHTFTLSLPVTAFPCKVEVRGFARNQAGTLGESPVPGAPALLDTVTVVAGATRRLVNGGVIADAVFHKATDNLYLTNIEQNEVEVFNLADATFHSPIKVGSRPWGITVWPRNRNGDQGDTLLVANSGGTDISYINVQDSSEVFRYPLPNFGVFTVTTTLSSTTGQPIQERTAHEFSDRPQFVAATCRGPATPGTPCGDVILVYSTTPTPTQSAPFANRGTIRWEDLSDSTSHFFFEQAQGQAEGRSDTLVIERYAAGGVGSDSVLVPFSQPATVGGVAGSYSVVIDIDKLGFRDTTFVRNSGNFARVIVGEGGPVKGSRALSYDATVGLNSTMSFDGVPVTFSQPMIDGGVSRPVDVSDFIGNSAANVSGASINFDGELAAIRGDSTYLIDPTLRLRGTLQTSGGSPGFDFHPENAGTGSSAADPSKRIAFAASSQPEIQVYDTYFYTQLCQPIPIRDPIIGPIKAAIRSSTGDLVLVGATQDGVVIVTLPSNFAATCTK